MAYLAETVCMQQKYFCLFAFLSERWKLLTLPNSLEYTCNLGKTNHAQTVLVTGALKAATYQKQGASVSWLQEKGFN